MSSSKKQVSGSHSTNLQAEKIIIKSGVSYTEAREIASAVYRENFSRLAAEASKKALEAVESFNAKYVGALNEAGFLERLNEPSIQMLLVQAQKSAIASGSKSYEECILNVLIERTKSSQRGVVEIAQEEAISLLSKITDNQLNILSMAYLMNSCRHLLSGEVVSREFFGEHAAKFYFKASSNSTDLTHLEYLGCVGKRSENNAGSFSYAMSRDYPGIYADGFSRDEFLEAFSGLGFEGLIELREGSNLYRPIDVSFHGLLKKAKEIKPDLDNEQQARLKSFLRKGCEGPGASFRVEDFYISNYPGSRYLFSSSGYALTGLVLSPTGIAIARANFMHKINWNLPWMIFS